MLRLRPRQEVPLLPALRTRPQLANNPSLDFCADLLNYTATLLRPGGPLVNSISYGWQGQLEQVGCKMAEVSKIDANWAKLAAAGVSVFISSGDSGSQCTSSKCDESAWKNVVVASGEVVHSRQSRKDTCCEEADSMDAAAFTWTPPPGAASPSLRDYEHLYAARAGAPPSASPPAPPYRFHKATYHVGTSEDTTHFPLHDVHVLDGTLGARAGSVSMHSANGTYADTQLHFGPIEAHSGPVYHRNISATLAVSGKATTFHGRAFFFGPPLNRCDQLLWQASGAHGLPQLIAAVQYGPNPPPPPPEGNCTIYKSISSLAPATDRRTVTGGPAISPEAYTLYPSWPASSPWVTSVGATRFALSFAFPRLGVLQHGRLGLRGAPVHHGLLYDRGLRGPLPPVTEPVGHRDYDADKGDVHELDSR